MKHPRRLPIARAVLALPAALAAMATHAEEPDPRLAALTQPEQRVTLGVQVQSRYDAKAEEYSGVTRRGPLLDASIDLAGGAAYDAPDNGLRWSLRGDHLGLRSREVEGALGVQGLWRVRLGYDELQRNGSDSYQTPYQGVGGHVLTLPAGWLVPLVPRVSATAPNARGLLPAVTASPAIVSGVVTPPTAAQAATAAAIQAADLPAFQQVDLFTRRSAARVAGEVNLGESWLVGASLVQEHREGLKAQPGQSRATGGDTASILPAPVDETDRRLGFTLGYTGATLQASASLETSSFTNAVPSVTWSLWALPTQQATLATAPDNRHTRLSLSLQWQPAPGWRVQGAASHGRSTQDVAFLTDTTAPLVPEASAHARVDTDSASLRLLVDAAPGWQLSAGARFEERDNRTPVALFGYYDNNNAASGKSPFAALFPQLTGLGQNFNLNANTPYSRRTRQLEAGLDRRLAGGDHLKAGVETRETERWCNGSWINCADAPTARENSLRGDWIGTLADDVDARLGAAIARRRVDYDENAFLARVPMAAQSPSTATGAIAGSTAWGTLQALGLTGYGPVRGLQPAAPAGSALAFYFPNNNVLDNLLYGNENRISELIGMRRYDQADRQRRTLRSALTWRASEAWTAQAGLDLGDDRYLHSTYGLQRQSSATLNVDASWSPDAHLSISAFASGEYLRTRQAGNSYTANSTATAVNGATVVAGGCFATLAQRNSNNKIDPCLDWSAISHDLTTTLGLAFNTDRLAGGQLALDGAASYSRARGNVSPHGGNYVNNPFAGVGGDTTAAYFVPAIPLPPSSVNALQLRLAGTWALARTQAVRVSWGLRQLHAADWSYEGLQDGGLTQVLPTRETAPHYRVNTLGLAYLSTF